MNYINRAHIALIEFNEDGLTVYTTAGFKIGFLGEAKAQDKFSRQLAQPKLSWIRIPDTLRALPCGIAR